MDKLPSVKTIKKSKRVGRGYGSGKGGHTVGRGQKGQKSRSSTHILFEGTKLKKSLLRRLPLQRGKARFKASPKPVIIKLDYLNVFKAGEKVTIDSLAKKGIVKKDEAQKYGVKILGGKLDKKLTVTVPVSKSAGLVIEKLGGKIN